MNFCEKIDKVLKTNTLGISSIGSLESEIGVSNGTIQKPYNKKRHPGLRTVKKIIELLRINQDWWDSGKGEIYTTATKSTYETKTMDMDVWELIKGSNKIHEASHKIFELEFERLWGLIEKFGPPAPSLNKDPIIKNGN